MIVDNGWLAVNDTINGFEEYELKVSDFVRNSYSELISEYKRLRQLPSLAYLSGNLKAAESIRSPLMIFYYITLLLFNSKFADY